ncbi:MAG TPA: DUF692 domain-containing protein [Gammaproteobacteria bacterium]|jgi:uncharacterized protein (UPF0276 family)|nr:DUF692 domain-containing protein [Gammaproteobacteria bacterium]
MFYKPSQCHGVGINYRSAIANDILQYAKEIDFIEMNTERLFFHSLNENLKNIIDIFPVTLHGLTLSLGEENQVINKDYLSGLLKATQRVDCLWFSEHIGMTRTHNMELRSLMPVEFTEKSVDRIVKKVKLISGLVAKPFLLENISYYYPMPMSTMSEVNFIKAVVEKADCGLLLDLNNLYINAINHHYDPYAFIDALPLERIVEVHLAGCHYLYRMWVDTHATEVRLEVLALFEYLCKLTRVNGVVIERDAKLERFSDLLSEIKIVREILKS